MFLDPVFPAQTAFLSDPARLKAALCTRRSGKSYGAGSALLKEASENPGCTCLFIALTRDSAKKIIWRNVLKVIDRKLGLGCKFNETELSCTLPNGSVIYILGVDTTEDEKEKLLGQKYRLVVIDEAASYTIDLHDLVYRVLMPAIADDDGSILLIGTPGNIKKGLFFDVTHEGMAGWSVHRWGALDNPYMKKQWLALIATLKAARPLIEETPLFQQDYLGRWVIDESKLVYRYQLGRNDFDKLPTFPHRKGRWHYGLGIDIGFNDPTAFTVAAYHDHDPVLYFLEAAEFLRLDVTDVAKRVKRYQERYEPLGGFDLITIDGANKQAVVEMQRRHHLPLETADKAGKADFIEIMNGEFIEGRIKLNRARCSWSTENWPDKSAPASLADEYGGLIWDDRSKRREEHPSCSNHCTDATLYIWRKMYAYLSSAIIAAPQPGTPAFAEKVAREMEEALQLEDDAESDTGLATSNWEDWAK